MYRDFDFLVCSRVSPLRCCLVFLGASNSTMAASDDLILTAPTLRQAAEPETDTVRESLYRGGPQNQGGGVNA